MAPLKTLDLESVKELSKQPMLTIPRRYLRVDQEPPITLSSPITPIPNIPIVDMQKLVMGEDKDEQLHKLHSICQEWGFFQLVNHGVSSLLVEKLKHEIKEFYKLPEEAKKVYKVRQGDVEGYGQTLIFEEDQKMDWADRFFMITNPLHSRKEHLFPQLPSTFRETLELYILELQKLVMSILRSIAKALEIDYQEMKDVYEDGLQAMRMTYYPPCSQPEAVIGITPHSDASSITILLQCNEVDGLQVKKNGVWIPVNVLPNSFIVNIGDAFEIFSNGAYKSIEHRATVNEVKERISLAMFFNHKFESEVGPARSITHMNPNNPPLFKRIPMKKYYEDFYSRKLDGKSFLEQYMRILDGYPNTTA